MPSYLKIFDLLRCISVQLILLTCLHSAAFASEFRLGINADNWSGQIKNPGFERGLRKMSPDFIVWHLSPEEEVSASRLEEILLFCRKNNWAYLFNTELVNYAPGVDYFKQEDGTYRWDLRPATMEKLKNDPLFLGVVYDEPMFMQSLAHQVVNKNRIVPYFYDTKDLDEKEAFTEVSQKIAALNTYYAGYNKRLVFEMVFPDYAHPVARGGAIAAPKLLKENYNDLMLGVYSGAAIQYKQRELWACVDLWFLDQFPFSGKTSKGHSPEQLFKALCYTYEKGFDYVYVEMVKALMDEAYNLTKHGEQLVAFQTAKAGLTRRDWNDVSPGHIIKRVPDGYWGQDFSGFIPDHPYGIKKRTPELKEKSREWLQLLNRLSNGRIPENANNWNAVSHPYYSKKAYISEAGLPEILVFDHHFEDSGRYPQSTFHDFTP